jgi:hypothetical protein
MDQAKMMNDNYRRYIEGKRVVFVVPAPNLKGLGQGRFIDDFDVVVRTNNFINLLGDPEITRDYGSKCHVLYCNRQFYREMRPFPVLDWKERGLEWICLKHAKGQDKQAWRSLGLKVRTIHETVSVMVKICPSVLMGPLLLSELSWCSPRELYVLGIDFNITRPRVFSIEKGYPEYVSGYLPPQIVEQGNRINIGKSEDPHHPKENTKIIYDLWRKERLTMPAHLCDLMLGIVEGRLEQN